MKKWLAGFAILFLLIGGSFGGLLMMTTSLGAGEAAASASAQSCSDVQNESANPSDGKNTTNNNAKAFLII